MHVLETERLILRHLSRDDGDFILELLNEPAFIRNIGDRSVRSIADAVAYIEARAIASYERFGFGLYAVVAKETMERLGICGLIQRDFLHDPDIGFAFLSRYWSKGYAVESARAVTKHARDVLGLARLAALVLPENASSIRVLQKIGFAPESRVRISPQEAELELYAAELTAGGAERMTEGAADESRGAVDSSQVDHLVFATPDLSQTVEDFERRFGVRAAPGGRHLGRGSHNALLALGPSSYLEIIGPDPTQPEPALPRWFGLDALEAPRLVAWAANCNDLEGAIAAAARFGTPLGEVSAGSRARADGVVLRWRFTDPSAMAGVEGVVPFLIDWGESPHPATTAPGGLRLLELRAEHPDPHAITAILAALGISLRVDEGMRPTLIASLEGPRGRAELR